MDFVYHWIKANIQALKQCIIIRLITPFIVGSEVVMHFLIPLQPLVIRALRQIQRLITNVILIQLILIHAAIIVTVELVAVIGWELII